MSHCFARGCCGAVLAYAVATQGALADLTAQDVWSDWKSYMTGVGYTVTGTEAMAGNALTVSGVSMSMPLPDEAGSVALTASELVFSENGDGTVSVTFPAMMPMVFAVKDGDDDVQGEVGISQTDAALVVSGSPQDMTYDYSAAAMRMALSSLTVDGQALPPEIGSVTVDLANLQSRTQMKIGEIREYSQTMSAGSLSYDVAFKDPDSDDMAKIKGTLTGITSDGSGRIPLQLNPEDMPAMLAAGFGIDVRLDYQSGNSDWAIKGDGEDMTYVSSSQGGAFGVAMDAAHLMYHIAQTKPSVAVTSRELPFPVEIDLSAFGFTLDMPLAKSDDLQPFTFNLNLADFVMSDMLWGMFDPAGVLPRDPATVTVDSQGQVKMLVDLMDTEAMENLSAPPAEIHALSIPNLVLSAVGASLSGNGAFTFDNTDLVSYDGIPAPRGTANLRIVGANGLIDRLIQMGLLPDQEAMGMRMMLGMFTVPGEGEDTLTSTIEFNDQGQILANGQRIK